MEKEKMQNKLTTKDFREIIKPFVLSEGKYKKLIIATLMDEREEVKKYTNNIRSISQRYTAMIENNLHLVISMSNYFKGKRNVRQIMFEGKDMNYPFDSIIDLNDVKNGLERIERFYPNLVENYLYHKDDKENLLKMLQVIAFSEIVKD